MTFPRGQQPFSKMVHAVSTLDSAYWCVCGACMHVYVRVYVMCLEQNIWFLL